MNLKHVLVGLLLVGLVGALGFLAYHFVVLTPDACGICGRPAHAEHYSRVELRSGRGIRACCPRCALHYRMNMAGKIERVLVADNSSGRLIDARNAAYVEGSDLEPCTRAAENAPREPGVDYAREFDRCLPSLIAFGDESAAREFQLRHGGHVFTYAQAEESVRRR